MKNNPKAINPKTKANAQHLSKQFAHKEAKSSKFTKPKIRNSAQRKTACLTCNPLRAFAYQSATAARQVSYHKALEENYSIMVNYTESLSASATIF